MSLFKNYPNFTVIFSCLFWGTYWIPLRFIDNLNNSSVWPIILSFVFVFILFINTLKKSFFLIFYNKNYFFFFGCFFSAMGIALYSESLLRGEIAKATVLFYLCPIWASIFAKIFLKNILNKKRLISIILGLIGLEIIIGFEKGNIFPTSIIDWIALFAGMSWALGTTFFHLANTTKAIEKTIFTIFLIPVIYLSLSFIPGGRNLVMPEILFTINYVYFWIILFAIIWLLPSILLIFYSVEILDPGRINILLAFEVVVGFSTAGLLTNEIIGARELLGAFFVISACFIDVIKNRN